jgi:hypothetical protein
MDERLLCGSLGLHLIAYSESKILHTDEPAAEFMAEADRNKMIQKLLSGTTGPRSGTSAPDCWEGEISSALLRRGCASSSVIVPFAMRRVCFSEIRGR